MENLTRLFQYSQMPENEGKMTFKYENDDVLLCYQKKIMHMIAGTETNKVVTTHPTKENEVITCRVVRQLPKIAVDFFATKMAMFGEEMVAAHLSKLTQRRSRTSDGDYVSVDFNFGQNKKEVIIQDIFEKKKYLIICESYSIKPETKRYEVISERNL